MSLLVLNQQEVEQLLDMAGCIEVMAGALASLARGEVHVPLRAVIRPPGEDTFVGLMPAHRGGSAPLYSLKTVCVFPDNPKRGLDAHQGTVTLFDGETGETRAIMNASAITAIRTAAVSAVATRLLAREDARELGILGAGVQARTHLEAMRLVRDFDQIRIFSPTATHAEALAAESGVEAVGSAEEAVRDADVVVTATSSVDPVLRREWLKEGAHVNVVGGRPPTTLTCAPSFSHSRRSTGSTELVAVTTTSASRTASSALPTASTPDSAASASACVAVGEKIRIWSKSRTSRIASRCVRACTPAPRMPSSRASSRASSRVATADTAAVRIAVIAEAFMIARVSPVSPSKSVTVPWCASRPRLGLSGKTHTVFRE